MTGHGPEPSEVPDVIALRFRDLEVPNTIREHELVLESLGFVWWGWWHKPGELVPRSVLSSLAKRAVDEGPQEVLLIDSGHLSLYRAQLVEVAFSASEDPMEAPELSAVPPYYAIVKRKAWFKFGAIEVLDPSYIHGFAYVELPADEFADDPASGFFEGKRVADLAELVQRPQTMWFFRPARPDDPAEPIDLEADAAPASVVERGDRRVPGIRVVGPSSPAPFMRAPISEPQSHYFVQFSDLHFGPTHRYSLESELPLKKSLALSIRDDLYAQFRDVPPFAIVLSGDLTWTGDEGEFGQAARFIGDLASWFKLSAQNFIVVPGNHDIRWTSDPDDFDPEKEVTASPPEAEANYRQFITDTLLFRPNDDLSMGRRFTTSSYGWLDIVGLNSCRLEQRRFAGHGLITYDSFTRAAKSMDWDSEPRGQKRRFVVTHHHLLPALPRERIGSFDTNFSVSLDAGEILVAALKHEADVIAHGHMHQPVAHTYARNAAGLSFPGTRLLGVHGAGSAGLKPELLGPIGKNSYTIYEFDHDEVVVRIRVASEFVADGYDDHAVIRFRENLNGGGLREVDSE